jgi:hypothetical protein
MTKRLVGGCGLWLLGAEMVKQRVKRRDERNKRRQSETFLKKKKRGIAVIVLHLSSMSMVSLWKWSTRASVAAYAADALMVKIQEHRDEL